jgi:hypothetical protein
MLAWHFLPRDARLQFGGRSKVRIGQTLRRDPAKLFLCRYGLHAAVQPLDALNYAPGPVVCRVRLGGTIIEGSDKHVASRRTVLWMADAGRELRRFACWCVRNTPLHDGRMVWDLLTDERSRAAVEVAERYADGLATDDELWLAALMASSVLLSAAGVARLAAARSAESAAWWSSTSPSAAAMEASASAREATGEVASEVASMAASAMEVSASAREAAWLAAWWCSATASAERVAWSAQNAQLEIILSALGEGK